ARRRRPAAGADGRALDARNLSHHHRMPAKHGLDVSCGVPFRAHRLRDRAHRRAPEKRRGGAMSAEVRLEPAELRARALAALALREPDAKCAAVNAMQAGLRLDASARLEAP